MMVIRQEESKKNDNNSNESCILINQLEDQIIKCDIMYINVSIIKSSEKHDIKIYFCFLRLISIDSI
jgi:hypothetical protein